MFLGPKDMMSSAGNNEYYKRAFLCGKGFLFHDSLWNIFVTKFHFCNVKWMGFSFGNGHY